MRKSTVRYDVNCCGVSVDRSGVISEEFMTQAVKNIADEVKLLSRREEMYRSKFKVWVIHYRYNEREQKKIKVDKRFYNVKRFDFGLYYKEVEIIRRRKLIEGRCMWSVVSEILLMKNGKENEVLKSRNDYCNIFLVLIWNAAGWLSNGLEFGFLVNSMENPPAVICIQECKLKGGVRCKIKEYVCYRKDKVDSLHACGGVLIFVSEDVSSYEVECEYAEMLKVNVNYGKKNYTVVNVYVRDAKEIDGLTECSGKERCIVCGDFNTHHGMLGSDRVNRNGYSLEKVLEETKLSVVNDATPTKFSVTGKGSVLDLFFVSSDIVRKCEMKMKETSCGRRSSSSETHSEGER